MFTIKGHYYTLFLSACLFVSAQEVHKNSRDPFKACEKLGPQGPGAATARLGVVLAGESQHAEVASLFRMVASKAYDGMKWVVLLIGNFRGGK